MMLDKNIDDKKIRPAPHLSAINVSANNRPANSSAIPRQFRGTGRPFGGANSRCPLNASCATGVWDPADSPFDYGCGHGDDLRALQALGCACDWLATGGEYDNGVVTRLP
jgi:hypothetical protein